MNVHTIAATGLSSNDMLVLLSTLRLREQEGCAWRCVDDPGQADVVLVPTDTRAARDELALAPDTTRPIRVAVVPPHMAPSLAGKTFTLPLRARELLPQLRGLECRLTRTPPRHMPQANEASVAMNATDLLRMLRDPKACADRAPMTLRQGAENLILIDADDAPSSGERLRWQSSTQTGFSEFCRGVASGLPLSIDSHSVSASMLRGKALSSGALSALVWAIATHDPRPEPVTEMGDGILFGLDHWPDFGKLPVQPMQMRLAAVLLRRAMSASQLAAYAGATRREVVRFLNACHGLGALSVRSADDTVPTPLAPSAPLTHADVPARGLGLLMRSIRQALRLGVHGGAA